MNWDKLIGENIELANMVAARARRRYSFIPTDEMRSITYLALVRAAKTFDPTFGIEFGAYATSKMHNEIKDEIRNRMGYRLKHKRPTQVTYDEVEQRDEQASSSSDLIAKARCHEHRHANNSVDDADEITSGLTQFQGMVAVMLSEGYSRVEIARQLQVRPLDIERVIGEIIVRKGYDQ